MMPSGLVLLFGYNHRQHFFDEEGGFQLWDPARRAPAGPKQSFHNYNPFCAGQSFLGDGRLFVAGGYKSGDPFRASAADQVRLISVSGTRVSWDASFGKMENKRWYPTCVTLATGDSFIIGGAAPFAADNWKDTDEDLEYFDLARNRLLRHDKTKKQLPRDGAFHYPHGDRRQKVADGKRLAGLYPLAHLLPNVPGDDAPQGLLFVLTESFVRVYNPATNKIVRPKQDVGGFRTWWTQASSVLLPIDVDLSGNGPNQVRIMIFGGGSLGVGGDEGKRAPALNKADVWVFDVNRRALSFEQSLQLNRPRFMGDSILLPDGSIALVGGASRGYTNSNSKRVLTAELIQPPTAGSPGSVTDARTARDPRGYHASSVLLPDGAIFVTGGNGQWDHESSSDTTPPEEWKSVEIFEPPYFGAPTRPRILRSPSALSAGDQFEVITDADVASKVILIRCGARTHSLDTDQRMLRLEARMVDNGNGTANLSARVPTNPTLVPPGPYFLWVLRGCADIPSAPMVPSLGQLVSVKPMRR
jgi:hypothetical protein